MSELKIYQNRPYPTEPMLNVSVEWVTQITENRSGKENRIPKITEPQYTIEGSDFALRDDDYDVFVDAFINAEGKNNAFPFKCPLDYYCAKDIESYDDGSFQRGILFQIDSLNYQIVKQYSVGGVNTYKTITLPVDGTIHVYQDDVEVFPTVNLSTGVVAFASIPTGSLKVECEFRLPMRFDVDDNQLNQIKRAVNSIYSANDTSIYLAVNFRLVEDMNYIRISPIFSPFNSKDWKGNVNYIFDGNPLSDVAYSERSLTRIQSSDNKRELRDGLGVIRSKMAIANNNMNWNATQKYFNLFMACKGRLLPFTFEDKLVRLDSDIFNVSMVGYSNVKLLPSTTLTWTLTLRYKDNASDPFTNLLLTFNALSVESILLGELNNLSNGIGTSGFPSINYVAQSTGGETLYVQVSIIDAIIIFGI
jgi:uncharacterized protein (TIGR02217 family)